MNDFKVGDWVRYINGKNKTTAQVKIINQISNYIGVSTGENVHIDDCEPWQPKEGEWCWFRKIDNGGIPDLRVFSHTKKLNENYTHDKQYVTKGANIMNFDGYYLYCEPFIGELPSFIKDK